MVPPSSGVTIDMEFKVDNHVKHICKIYVLSLFQRNMLLKSFVYS